MFRRKKKSTVQQFVDLVSKERDYDREALSLALRKVKRSGLSVSIMTLRSTYNDIRYAKAGIK